MEEERVEKSSSDKPTSERIQEIREFAKYLLITLVIVVPIRLFVIQPFAVHGKSMYPTFDDYHYLLVEKIDYYFHNANRGDVIIFKYPNDPSKYFIKRVIGLPGETVKIQYGKILVSGPNTPEKEITEDYVKLAKDNEVMNITLSNDEYFVMGDNRIDSLDSRSWGPLPKENITGKVWLRLYPFNKLGVFPGSTEYK